ncbi:MAG: acyl carrier protein [Acidiferrobacteraceae bacterium]
MISGVKEKVLAYITDNFLMGLRTGEIREDSSLLDLGIIDSTGVIELIAFLEEAFGIHVDDEEITPENLDSLRRIERYVKVKAGMSITSSMTA